MAHNNKSEAAPALEWSRGRRSLVSRSRVLRHSLSSSSRPQAGAAVAAALLRKQQQQHAAGTAALSVAFEGWAGRFAVIHHKGWLRQGLTRAARQHGDSQTGPRSVANFRRRRHRAASARQGEWPSRRSLHPRASLPARRRHRSRLRDSGLQPRRSCHRVTLTLAHPRHTPRCAATRPLLLTPRSDTTLVIRLFRTIIAADRFFCTFPFRPKFGILFVSHVNWLVVLDFSTTMQLERAF